MMLAEMLVCCNAGRLGADVCSALQASMGGVLDATVHAGCCIFLLETERGYALPNFNGWYLYLLCIKAILYKQTDRRICGLTSYGRSTFVREAREGRA